MSCQTKTYLACDLCPSVFETSARYQGVDAIRKAANKKGWRYEGGRDICKKHNHSLKK